MRNPWIKKNPLLSMWLSGANVVVGSARSRATAQAKRQAAAIMAENTKLWVGFWSDMLSAPAPRKRRRRR